MPLESWGSGYILGEQMNAISSWLAQKIKSERILILPQNNKWKFHVWKQNIDS